MAFDSSALSPIYMGGKGGQKVWSYITTDDPLAIASEGYFVLEDMPVQAGDFFIIAHVDDVNSPSTATSISISCVTSVENKVAAINNQSGGDLLASNNLSDLVSATVAKANLGIPLNKYDATTPPGLTDDSTQGFSVGSEYAVPSLSEVYLCLDASENNAVWLKTSSVSTVIKNTYDATSAPTANHDETQGYSVGSEILIASNNALWICFDATEGAAAWRKVSGAFAALDELPDNSTTLAKMEHGTTGDILYYGESGAPTRLSAGTEGQVLKQGSIYPGWGDEGGGLVLLATATASNSSSVDFTSNIDGTYDEYIIECIGVVPVSDNQALVLRTSSDGGVSFDAGASDYSYVYLRLMDGSTSNTVYQSSAYSGMLIGAAIGNTNGENYHGTIRLYNPANTALRKTARYDSIMVRESGDTQRMTGMATRESNSAIDALRLQFLSGNIASGKFKLYGVR